MVNHKKRLVIIDDHPLFREGLKTILSRKAQYEVVGEAGTGREGLHMISNIRPDLVLLDLSLPDVRGIDLIRDILEISSNIGILIVSMHSKIDYIVKSFQHGAMGYIIKELAAKTLLDGIEHILKGNYYMDTSVSQQVVKKLVGLPAKETVSTNPGYELLTPREQEIMALLVEGITVGQVADKLFISRKTAENHRSNIMRKLGLHGTIELVRYAVKIGLIDIDLWR